MTWERVAAIIKSEVGEAASAPLIARIEHELRGARVTVPAKASRHLTHEDIQKALRAAGWKIDAAAAALGVHPRTVYRHLQSKRKQTQTAPCGTYQGRLVR